MTDRPKSFELGGLADMLTSRMGPCRATVPQRQLSLL
jgi:hypothetical protein